MKMIGGKAIRFGLVLGVWFLVPGGGRAQGIPEPPIILYGTLRNTAENNVRMESGTLTWQFRNQTSGQTVQFSTPVVNLLNLDQFSYVLEVPCEQVVSANLPSNVLSLSAALTSFDRSQVLYNGLPVGFVTAAQSNVVLSARSRGQIERVDLQVSAPCEDWDGNGLCDDWEWYYFGVFGYPRDRDFDGDGMSDWSEYKAGTNPADPSSAFQFLNYERVGASNMRVTWESSDGRYYTLLRYPSLMSTNFSVVQSGIFATTPLMSWEDTNAPSPGPYFYRLLLEP